MNKEKKIEIIIKALKERKNVNQIMDITWGPRAEWEIRGQGIYSFDGDYYSTWEEEKSYLANELDTEKLNKAYEIAKRGLKSSNSISGEVLGI